MSGTIGAGYRVFQDGVEVEAPGQPPAISGNDIVVMPQTEYDERGVLNTVEVPYERGDVESTLEWLGELEPESVGSEDGESEPAVYGDPDEQEEPEDGADQVDDDAVEHISADSVPDTPADYYLPDIPGVPNFWDAVLENEKPFVGEYLELFHEHELTQAAAADLLTLYAQNRINLGAMLNQADRDQTDDLQAELTSEWGENFRPILDEIKALLQDTTFFPPGFIDRFKEARFPDGTRVSNDPHLIRFLARAAVRSERYTSEEVEDQNSELAAIEELRDENLDLYRTLRKWGPQGNMTGDERWYEIMKARAA